MKKMLRLAAALMLLASACGNKGAVVAYSANDVQEFHAAVQDGDAVIVERLLRAKPRLANARNAAGDSPLAVANRQAEPDVAAVIKKYGGKD